MDDATAARLDGEKKRARRFRNWAVLWCVIAAAEWVVLVTEAGCP